MNPSSIESIANRAPARDGGSGAAALTQPQQQRTADSFLTLNSLERCEELLSYCFACERRDCARDFFGLKCEDTKRMARHASTCCLYHDDEALNQICCCHPFCSDARFALNHYAHCKEVECPLCSPIGSDGLRAWIVDVLEKNKRRDLYYYSLMETSAMRSAGSSFVLPARDHRVAANFETHLPAGPVTLHKDKPPVDFPGAKVSHLLLARKPESFDPTVLPTALIFAGRCVLTDDCSPTLMSFSHHSETCGLNCPACLSKAQIGDDCALVLHPIWSKSDTTTKEELQCSLTPRLMCIGCCEFVMHECGLKGLDDVESPPAVFSGGHGSSDWEDGSIPAHELLLAWSETGTYSALYDCLMTSNYKDTIGTLQEQAKSTYIDEQYGLRALLATDPTDPKEADDESSAKLNHGQPSDKPSSACRPPSLGDPPFETNGRSKRAREESNMLPEQPPAKKPHASPSRPSADSHLSLPKEASQANSGTNVVTLDQNPPSRRESPGPRPAAPGPVGRTRAHEGVFSTKPKRDRNNNAASSHPLGLGDSPLETNGRKRAREESNILLEQPPAKKPNAAPFHTSAGSSHISPTSEDFQASSRTNAARLDQNLPSRRENPGPRPAGLPSAASQDKVVKPKLFPSEMELRKANNQSKRDMLENWYKMLRLYREFMIRYKEYNSFIVYRQKFRNVELGAWVHRQKRWAKTYLGGDKRYIEYYKGQFEALQSINAHYVVTMPIVDDPLEGPPIPTKKRQGASAAKNSLTSDEHKHDSVARKPPAAQDGNRAASSKQGAEKPATRARKKRGAAGPNASANGGREGVSAARNSLTRDGHKHDSVARKPTTHGGHRAASSKQEAKKPATKARKTTTATKARKTTTATKARKKRGAAGPRASAKQVRDPIALETNGRFTSRDVLNVVRLSLTYDFDQEGKKGAC